MNIVVILDLITAIVLIFSLVLLARVQSDLPDPDSKRFLYIFFLIYLAVTVSNILEHGGITAFFDLYEDYLEVLMVPIFLFFLYSVENYREITERKEAEKALLESEAKYHELFDSSPDAIFIVDMQSKNIIDANPSALNLYGYTMDTILDTPFINVSGQPQKTEKSLEEASSEFSLNRTHILDQRIHRKKDSTLFPVEVAYGSFDIAGRSMIFIISRDTTDRVRAKEALVNEKERLAITLRSIGDGVITTDAEGRVTLMNYIAEKLTGWSESEAIGKPLYEVFRVVNSETRQLCDNPVKQVLERGKVVGRGNANLLISRNKTEYAIADSGAPIFNIENHIIGIVLVFRDVTETRRMENELLKVEKLESLGVLAGGIAHDFNNFLGGIIGNLSLARLELDPSHKVRSKLREMEKAALRAKNLTQQLLTFSKGGEPVKHPVNLTELVKESALFALRGSNVRCDFIFQSDQLTAEVDEGQFSQVIHNLIINAYHAMPEGGVVRIIGKTIEFSEDNPWSLKAGNYVTLSIQDQGVGIDKKHLTKIFDPYFSTKQKGSGLGLTVAYSIIDKHAGRIEVSSELGKGTLFVIYLPLTNVAEPEQEIGKGLIQGAEGAILVMDDEDFIRELAYQMLTKMGYSVTLSKNGDEAVQLYRQAFKKGCTFDAVILDLTVPGSMGGKEAIRQILQIDQNAKAVVSSGYSNDPVMSNYSLYGFQAAVKKPYLIEEMSDALRCVLPKSINT